MDLDCSRDSGADCEWLLQLVDALPMAAVFRYTQFPDGTARFEHASSGFQRMFGFSPELLCEDPSTLFEMIPEEQGKRMARLGGTSLATGEAFNHEGPILLASGETRWIQWHARVSRSDAGGNHWDGICMDVTRRKEVELHARRLEGILPICSNCKKIRDGESRWRQVDEYITRHSEAKFSHGMCPECMRELYGEEFLEDSPQAGASDDT